MPLLRSRGTMVSAVWGAPGTAASCLITQQRRTGRRGARTLSSDTGWTSEMKKRRSNQPRVQESSSLTVKCLAATEAAWQISAAEGSRRILSGSRRA